VAAKLALRSIARRIANLDTEIAEIDEELKPLVKKATPTTARPRRRSSAASSATSSARSTKTYEPTSPPSNSALDIYRNVPTE